jgi:sulfur transfer complex TusBCD TusB component (DsrH family)
MRNEIIHAVQDFVEVSYSLEFKAVILKWFSEYDESTAVKDAVYAALEYVCEHDVPHWLADISTSRRGLTEKDQKWVGSDDFRDAIANSPLRKFVLIPPLPETGQDVSWLADWEANTLAKFGSRVDAKLSSDGDEIRSFFLD